jgi:POT family proton-dependent oligopeptide transporter
LNIVLVAGILVTILTAIPVMLQLRGHPRGLYILFFAEMWERFSYYGMRALLIYYLTQHFLFDDKTASGQYGAYTTLIYLLPLAGGVLADRYLGMRKAIAFGALLLTIGQLALAIEGRPAEQVLTWRGASYVFQTEGRADTRHVRLKVGAGLYDFAPAPGDAGLLIKGLPAGAPLPRLLPKGDYVLSVKNAPVLFTNVMFLALSLIVVGVGFLKANIASIAGQLYGQADPRRDSGFTLYYYGMNLGAFWAAVVCGAVGESVGWWAGFGLAGLGMALGFVVFMLGKPLLKGKGEPPIPARLKQAVLGPLNLEASIYLGGLVAVGVVWLLLNHNVLVGYLLGIGSAAVLGYIGWFMAAQCDKVARERLGLALVLISGSVVFWTLFEQAGSSLSLFAERNTQLPHHGFVTMNASQTQSFNPGFILIFAPVFAALWARLGRRGRDPSPMNKFGLALVQVGLGFIVLVIGAKFADASYRLPLVFLGVAYLLHTTGELCLSPVGLSEATKLAPPVLISTLVAVWYLSISWAEWIGGKIAQLTGAQTVGGQVLDPKAALDTSIHIFAVIGWTSVGVGLLFFALAPFLKRWANGVNGPQPGGVVTGSVDAEAGAVSPGAAARG